MVTSGGAGASLSQLRHATPGPLHTLTTLLLSLLLLCSLVAAEAASPASQQPLEWIPQLPLESHVAVGADGIATSRGVGRRRSDGLSITRSIPVETGIAPDAAVDDQAIKFTPHRVDLGRMETCSPQRYYVGVENRGRVSVRLDGADFTHEGFSLATDVRGIRLDPGDRFNVQFVFLPSEVQPNGVDAHLRVLTTSGLFSLPMSGPEVALNRYGVSTVRASVPAGARFEQSLRFVNPLNYTIRITEMYSLDGFVHLELLNGSNWIGPRWPREVDEKEVAKEIPGQYDQQFDYARRADRGAWDMPAGTTSPLIKVSVQTHTPGVHFTYVHIAAGDRRLLLVPVRITVLKPGIHIEPKEVDLGVLTDLYEDEPRELFFSLYNAGLNPIEVLELKVLESNLIVAAQLRGSAVISPQTRAYHALAVQILVNRDVAGGVCIASLLLKTNASSSELGQRKLRLYGQVVKGHLAFQLNQTLMGVIMPLERVFIGDEEVDDAKEDNGPEQIVEDEETPTTSLVSIVGENISMAVVAGTSEFRKLRLWNRFDRPVELQRAWVDSALSEKDDPQEVTVHKFKQGIVSAGAALPTISLQITPTLQAKGKFLTSRSYSLMVETNATLHRIQVYMYHGILSVTSTRGLHNYSLSGYYSDLHTEPREQEPPRACFLVPKGGLVPTITPRIDGGKQTTDTHAVQICRSLLFDLDKVASHRSRIEMVEVTNENPVPLTLSIVKAPKSDTVDMSITGEISVTESVSQFPHIINSSNKTGETGVGDKWSNNTNLVSAGDSFVLQPGYRVVFHVEIKAKDTLGEITVPVMSMTTPSEVLHLYARFVSVRGTVEPVTPAVVLPAMFPGRTEVVHLQYRNTFEHLVTPLVATVSSSQLKLLSMRGAMAPKQVESVLDLLFSPGEDSKCSDALFLADCLLPLPDTVDEQTCEQLSDYGEFVDKHDLDALSRRDAFWSETKATEGHSTIQAQVRLRTDIMDDVAEVTIKALLERPMVTAPAPMALNPNNESLKEFALTELFELSHIFVHARNPSNISIQMELTIAEVDQALFYSCDLGLIWNELMEFNDVEYNGSDNVSELCLAEWKTTTADAVAQHQGRQEDIDVPSFYYEKSIIQVPAGEETQLGPIYYLPSKVQEVSTTVFVRNDLSHIEPVPLLARSGKGTLNVLVDAPVDSKSTKTCYTDQESAAVNEGHNTAESSAPVEFDGTLSFALSRHDASTGYTQDTEIVLSNTGPFGLTIRSVTVEGDDYDSWMPSTWTSDSPAITSDFVVTSDDFRGITGGSDDYKGAPVVLPPGKTANVSVSFCASCFAVRMASWLIIDTSDSVKRIRLEGTLTTNAAFSCLRSRMSPSMRFAFHAAWILTAGVAVISTLYTLIMLAHDAWTSDVVSEAQSLHFVVDTENSDTKVAEVSHRENHAELPTPSLENEGTAVPRTLASIKRALADMEQVAFAPPARVVTPAVAELLERRRKRLYTVVRNQPSENGQLSKNDELGGDDGGGITTALTAKAEASDNKAALPTFEVDRVPSSDLASTMIEASLRDVQKVVNAAGSPDTGTLLPSTNATQPARGATSSTDKLFEDSNDAKQSELSSEGESPEDLLSPASSSHSTIVQPDVDESSRSAEFPKLSFGPPGDQFKPGMGSSPIGTTSPMKGEGPFEAFKTLSARWRAETWRDNLKDPSPPSLSGKFPGLEDWNDTLSFNTLGHGLVGSTAGGNRCDENVRSGNVSRSEGSSFIGTSPDFYLDGFSPFAAPAAPLPTGATPTTATKKAPPGFTPADAKPLEARAAFERLRSSNAAIPSVPSASNSSDGFGGSSLFASKLPLFGPALPPTSDDHVTLGGAGRIGSGRSKVLRSLDIPQDTTK